MRQHFYSVRDFLLPVIDFFYPPFKRLMPLQTFRYAVSGGGNTVLGLAVYYITFRFILKEHDFQFGFYAFKSHNAALFISFCVSFIVGFFLMKYVVFDDSRVKGKVQLFRYFVVCIFNLILNYFILRLAVEYWHIYPTIAQLATTIAVILISYLAQRHFTFRRADHPGYLEEDDAE